MNNIAEMTFINDNFKVDTKCNLKEKPKNSYFENVLSDKLNNNEIKEVKDRQVISIRNYSKNKEQKKEKVNLQRKATNCEEIQKSKVISDDEKENIELVDERINMNLMLESIEEIIADISRILSNQESSKLNNDFKSLLIQLESIKEQNVLNLKLEKNIIRLTNQVITLIQTYEENKEIKMNQELSKFLSKLNYLVDDLLSKNEQSENFKFIKGVISKGNNIKKLNAYKKNSENKESREIRLVGNIKNEHYKLLTKNVDLIEDEIKENNLLGSKNERILTVNNQTNNLIEKFNVVKENILNNYESNLTNEKTLLQNIDKNMLMKQIIEKLSLNNEKTNPEIRIKLKPEVLGNLFLKITTKENLVLARIIVENYQVKQVIEANLDVLKDNLKEQGLEIYEFSIDVGQSANFDNYNSQSGYNRNYFMNQKGSQLINQDVEEEFLYSNEILNSLIDSSIDLKA
ncbi:flagellar hook-length control protein FliK [Caloranaerobacter ferrireducens]|uniref:flagellar hook-length control protein FliK n=1 Tax=Caloranaerobacter ferrireducens TaxID=1323370 RepID=UPI00084DC05C|nr:flagellar hook-length control protein FliK [Caloranaerobacter ferrireducens]